MATKERILASEQGFTLIEIIAVLVLLGILAAVAVPKYISLQAEAELKTIDSVKAELQSRANMYHGKYLLDNTATAVSQNLAAWAAESVGADFTLASGTTGLRVTPAGSTNSYSIVFTQGTTGANAAAAIFGTITKP